MKLNKWLYGAMALGMFAACSNDMPDNGPVISRDGDYMAVSINLPTVASTRAVNDNYDDGKPDEYKVNNGCLVIFKGEPDGEEKDAKFAAAYRLNGLDASETPDDKDETPVDNITTSYKKSVKLENLEYNENDKLYAFVMLNYIGIATVDESNSQLTVKGKDGDISADGNTFAQIFLTETKEDFHSHGAGNIETNFFMCNSPLSTAPGDLNQPNITEGFAIKTLVEINKDKIFSKREDAEKDGNSACSVNVERGLAKATINWQPTGFSDDSNVAANGKKPSFSVIGWTLDVKEPTTYIARNVEGANGGIITIPKRIPTVLSVTQKLEQHLSSRYKIFTVHTGATTLTTTKISLKLVQRLTGIIAQIPVPAKLTGIKTTHLLTKVFLSIATRILLT